MCLFGFSVFSSTLLDFANQTGTAVPSIKMLAYFVFRSFSLLRHIFPSHPFLCSVPFFFTVSISITFYMFVSLNMPLSCLFSDHEVHQSAGAGSVDRYRGEGTLHLRDGAEQRGLCYKYEGAEQR